MILLPYNFALRVLSIMVDHDPDIIAQYMSDFSPPSGKSFATHMNYIMFNVDTDDYLCVLSHLTSHPELLLGREPYQCTDPRSSHAVEAYAAIFIDEDLMEERDMTLIRQSVNALQTFDCSEPTMQAMGCERVAYISAEMIGADIDPDNPDPSPEEMMAGLMWDVVTAGIQMWKPELMIEH